MQIFVILLRLTIPQSLPRARMAPHTSPLEFPVALEADVNAMGRT